VQQGFLEKIKFPFYQRLFQHHVPSKIFTLFAKYHSVDFFYQRNRNGFDAFVAFSPAVVFADDNVLESKFLGF
jgi:hypothetical protein